MASEYAPDFIKKDEELQRRFPPRPLAGLGPALVWEPPAARENDGKLATQSGSGRCLMPTRQDDLA
jgi:hypothetical protein